MTASINNTIHLPAVGHVMSYLSDSRVTAEEVATARQDLNIQKGLDLDPTLNATDADRAILQKFISMSEWALNQASQDINPLHGLLIKLHIVQSPAGAVASDELDTILGNVRQAFVAKAVNELVEQARGAGLATGRTDDFKLPAAVVGALRNLAATPMESWAEDPLQAARAALAGVIQGRATAAEAKLVRVGLDDGAYGPNRP